MSYCHISVVSPIYCGEPTLALLCEELHKILGQITENYEIIFVNDSSPDLSWSVIESLAQEDNRVKGLDLSRNFGQHAAITAGLDQSCGEWVVVIDCDLQDLPSEISKLYTKAKEGFDIVWGRRSNRADGFFKRKTSNLFRKIFDFFTGNKSDPSVGNFGIYHRKVIDSYLSMREQTRAFLTYIQWLGFRNTSIDIKHAPRLEGRSGYSLFRLIKLASNMLVAHSNLPLIFSIKLGFFMSFSSFIYGLYLITRYFIHGFSIEGWTSVIVSIYFVGGLLFANLGIIGLYLGKVYDETKRRPLYVIREQTPHNKQIPLHNK